MTVANTRLFYCDFYYGPEDLRCRHIYELMAVPEEDSGYMRVRLVRFEDEMPVGQPSPRIRLPTNAAVAATPVWAWRSPDGKYYLLGFAGEEEPLEIEELVPDNQGNC